MQTQLEGMVCEHCFPLQPTDLGPLKQHSSLLELNPIRESFFLFFFLIVFPFILYTNQCLLPPLPVPSFYSSDQKGQSSY